MKTITFNLPKIINEERPEVFVVLQEELESESLKGTQQTLILDWGNVQSVELSGWAILSIFLDFFHELGISYRSIKMQRMYAHHPIGKLLTECKSPNALLPITSFRIQEAGRLLIGLENSITMSLIDQFKEVSNSIEFDEDLEFDCNMILTELMQNALDHSGSERYFIYLEITQEKAKLGCLDRGVSVPARLAMKYNFKDELEAIDQSLKNGITTRRTRIGGKGLYYTFLNLKKREGSLTYLSSTAQLKRHFIHRTLRKKILKAKLRGTWIFCQLKKVAHEN